MGHEKINIRVSLCKAIGMKLNIEIGLMWPGKDIDLHRGMDGKMANVRMRMGGLPEKGLRVESY